MADGGKILRCKGCNKPYYKTGELAHIMDVGQCKTCEKKNPIPVYKTLRQEQVDCLLEAMYCLNEIDMMSDTSRADFPQGGKYSSDMASEAVPIALLLDIFVAKYTPQEEQNGQTTKILSVRHVSVLSIGRMERFCR